MSEFKIVTNECTKNLENVIFKNQLPNQDILWSSTNTAYLLVAQLYLKLASAFDNHEPDILNGLVHSELTDTLIDTFTRIPDLYSTQNILIFNTDDGTICYDTESYISHDKIIDQDGCQELLQNLTYAKIDYMNSTYYLFID